MKVLAIAALLVAAVSVTAAEKYVHTGDGVRIWYRSVGKGTPVIVIHGGPGMDHGSLKADLRPLEKKNRVIYYDQRGGGRSSLPNDEKLLTIDHHVDDLEALRRHLRLEKVTLLAHSFGPAIAALYAIRHPARVERMIFLGPIPPQKGKFFEEYGAAMEQRLTPEQRKRSAELAESFGSAGPDTVANCREFWSIGTPPRVSKTLDPSLVKADLCTAPPEAIRFGMTKTNAITWGSLGEWDWRSDLAKVKAYVLIVHGEEDAIPMAMVSEWAKALPDARMLRLEDTGHFPHAERPLVVFPAIETFLDGRWPEGATRE